MATEGAAEARRVVKAAPRPAPGPRRPWDIPSVQHPPEKPRQWAGLGRSLPAPRPDLGRRRMKTPGAPIGDDAEWMFGRARK